MISIGVAISSCRHYFKQTGPRLIQEISEILATCDWNPQVILVVGGYDTESEENLAPNFRIINVPYQGFDFTAAYWLTQNPIPQVTHWFLSHDTVKFSFRFFHILHEFIPKSPATRLCNHYSMNMGIYSVEHLRNSTKKMVDLLIYENTPVAAQRGKQRIIDTEDCLFPEDAPILSTFRSIHDIPIYSLTGDRIGLMKVYFHDLDFTKYQQNTAWAKKIHTEAYLPQEV
jgi:hypothetical protein